MTVREHMEYRYAWEFNQKLESLFDKEVLKEFSMSGNKPWVSWREFGTHKNVANWFLVEGGYAIGYNENPSKGWSFPIKKLSSEQVEKYMKHTLTYEQYYNH